MTAGTFRRGTRQRKPPPHLRRDVQMFSGQIRRPKKSHLRTKDSHLAPKESHDPPKNSHQATQDSHEGPGKSLAENAESALKPWKGKKVQKGAGAPAVRDFIPG